MHGGLGQIMGFGLCRFAVPGSKIQDAQLGLAVSQQRQPAAGGVETDGLITTGKRRRSGQDFAQRLQSYRMLFRNSTGKPFVPIIGSSRAVGICKC